jgi:hypothetical protein
MSVTKRYRVLAACLAVLLLATMANDYLELGWFGSRSRLVVSILVLVTCVFAASAIRHDQTKKSEIDQVDR